MKTVQLVLNPKAFLKSDIPAYLPKLDFASFDSCTNYFFAIGLATEKDFSTLISYAQIRNLSAYLERPVLWTEVVAAELIDPEEAKQTAQDIQVLLTHGLIEEVQT